MVNFFQQHGRDLFRTANQNIRLLPSLSGHSSKEPLAAFADRL